MKHVLRSQRLNLLAMQQSKAVLSKDVLMIAFVAPSASTPCLRRCANRSLALGLSHSIVRHPVTEYRRTTSDSL
jgi:hypothetical protein